MKKTLTHLSNVATSVIASSIRLWSGTSVNLPIMRPHQTLELYDIEGCPYCRPVREALTELDMEAMIYPCPEGGTRFRGKVEGLGGRTQFPYLVDPGAQKSFYGTEKIIDYLYETYGQRKPPLLWRVSLVNRVDSMLASLSRQLAGFRAKPSTGAALPLELYSFESSPYCRLVRECLCELEIPYLLHNVGHTQLVDYIPPTVRYKLLPNVSVWGASQRAFVARSGKMQVPYLVDPNTGVAMFESAAIRDYLLNTYGLSSTD